MEENLCIGEYGIIKIIKGKYKGRFGYYDDDEDNKSIIYFGEMFDNANYCLINQEYITNDYTIDDLNKRKKEIIKELWSKITEHQRLNLLEEKFLIDNVLNSSLENYIDTSKISNKKLFLSHSSLDKSVVISIALDLHKKNINTWVDAFDILPGESIIKKINEGLEECDYILLFLSKNSVKSNWVTKEWESILWDEVNSNKIKIIPIKIEDCKIPKILQTKKYIDFSRNYNEGLNELIETIRKHEKM